MNEGTGADKEILRETKRTLTGEKREPVKR